MCEVLLHVRLMACLLACLRVSEFGEILRGPACLQGPGIGELGAFVLHFLLDCLNFSAAERHSHANVPFLSGLCEALATRRP